MLFMKRGKKCYNSDLTDNFFIFSIIEWTSSFEDLNFCAWIPSAHLSHARSYPYLLYLIYLYPLLSIQYRVGHIPPLLHWWAMVPSTPHTPRFLCIRIQL